jgi:phage terminase large subunit
MPVLTVKTKGLINTVYKPYIHTLYDREIFYGGSSSGKSYFLAQRTVSKVLSGRNILITRKIANTLNKSTWNEIVKAINLMGLKKLFKINKSDYTITAVNNQCQILFGGLDDTEKIKSITPIKGVLTDIWIEEATEVEYGDYKQLEKRLRGITKDGIKKSITLSFNPIYQTHWLYREFFGIWEDGKQVARGRINEQDVLIVKTTHQDNEFLTEQDHNALENEKDPYYKNVYTYGNWGVLGDVIFTNWRVEDISEMQTQFSNIRNGLDFGFSVDPFAYVRVHYDKMRKQIYVFKEFYEKGCTNDMVADFVRPIIGRERLICDSAEPKSIVELQNLGINATPANKGKDSVNFGIQFLQQHEIIIDKSCQNLKNELTVYQWKQDKDGNAIRQPVDKNNHLIDALRYALSEDMEFKKEPIGMVRVKI